MEDAESTQFSVGCSCTQMPSSSLGHPWIHQHAKFLMGVWLPSGERTANWCSPCCLEPHSPAIWAVKCEPSSCPVYGGDLRNSSQVHVMQPVVQKGTEDPVSPQG